jgi:hypothetical protein
VIDEEQFGFPLEGMEAAQASQSSHAIRLELNELLERAKAARDAAPWGAEMQRKYRILVPERAKALPAEEAEFLRRQFVLEFDRIERLLAA